MKLIYPIFISLSLIIWSSCQKSTEPIGNDKPPPGYQENISWPSLADTPWPMSRHDPQSTGRSNEIGPMSGIIAWSNDSFVLESGVSIGQDSTIYFHHWRLYAFSFDGIEKWTLDIGGYTGSAPIIAEDGTIYSTANNKLIAALPDGTIKWEYLTNYSIGWMTNIGKDGSIFILDPLNSLCAISPSGTLLWQYSDDRFTQFIISGMSFSPDGETLYVPGSTTSIIAFNIKSQSVEWTFGETKMHNPPVIDSDGNIYLLPRYDSQGTERGKFYALNKNGEVRWIFEFDYEVSIFNSNAPTIDKAGNIYFATDTLYSLDYSGKLNWKADLDGFCDCPLVCDINSNVYVGTMFSEAGISISSYDVNGNLNWKISDSQDQVGGSPAIGFNSLYFPTWKSDKIYCIK